MRQWEQKVWEYSLKESVKFYTDAAHQANILNGQFQSEFSPATVYTAEEFQDKCELDPTQHQTSFSNTTISEQGAWKLLRTLDPHKARSPDGISSRVLKELGEPAPILSLSYNSSVRSGTVPADRRATYVMPVFKKGIAALKTTGLFSYPVHCVRWWNTPSPPSCPTQKTTTPSALGNMDSGRATQARHNCWD